MKIQIENSMLFPKFSNEQKFMNSKLIKLLEATEIYDKNWKLISNRLKYFGEIKCQEEYSKLEQRWTTNLWLKSEDDKLKAYMKKNKKYNWFECSIVMKSKSPKQCETRWYELENLPNIVGNWRENEQALIFKLMRKYHFSWKKIAMFLPRRTADSIKSIFYSSIRQIKKSKLFQILKTMLCWPTSTNKSKNFFCI